MDRTIPLIRRVAASYASEWADDIRHPIAKEDRQKFVSLFERALTECIGSELWTSRDVEVAEDRYISLVDDLLRESPWHETPEYRLERYERIREGEADRIALYGTWLKERSVQGGYRGERAQSLLNSANAAHQKNIARREAENKTAVV